MHHNEIFSVKTKKSCIQKYKYTFDVYIITSIGRTNFFFEKFELIPFYFSKKEIHLISHILKLANPNFYLCKYLAKMILSNRTYIYKIHKNIYVFKTQNSNPNIQKSGHV